MVWNSTLEAVSDDREQTVPIDPAVGLQLTSVPDQQKGHMWRYNLHLFLNQHQFYDVLRKVRCGHYNDMAIHLAPPPNAL